MPELVHWRMGMARQPSLFLTQQCDMVVSQKTVLSNCGMSIAAPPQGLPRGRSGDVEVLHTQDFCVNVSVHMGSLSLLLSSGLGRLHIQLGLVNRLFSGLALAFSIRLRLLGLSSYK